MNIKEGLRSGIRDITRHPGAVVVVWGGAAATAAIGLGMKDGWFSSGMQVAEAPKSPTAIAAGQFTPTSTPTPDQLGDSQRGVLGDGASPTPKGGIPEDSVHNSSTWAVLFPSTGEVCKTDSTDDKVARQQAYDCQINLANVRDRFGLADSGINVDTDFQSIAKNIPCVGTISEVFACGDRVLGAGVMEGRYFNLRNLRMNLWQGDTVEKNLKGTNMQWFDTEVGYPDELTAENLDSRRVIDPNARYFLITKNALPDANGNPVDPAHFVLETTDCDNQIEQKVPPVATATPIPSTATPTPTPTHEIIVNRIVTKRIIPPVSLPTPPSPPPPAATETPIPTPGPRATPTVQNRPTEAPKLTPTPEATPTVDPPTPGATPTARGVVSVSGGSSTSQESGTSSTTTSTNSSTSSPETSSSTGSSSTSSSTSGSSPRPAPVVSGSTSSGTARQAPSVG